MIALDTNILVHAHQRQAEFHVPASERIRSLAEGIRPWAVCLHSFVEFYGIVTQPKLWREPSSPEQAMDQVGAWRESPSLRVLTDNVQLLTLLGELAIAGGIRGGKVHDARIAASCLLHGVETLWTLDRDFGRFPSIRTENPFVSAR